MTINNIMKLMAVNEGDGKVPLYMNVVQQVLRQMSMSNEKFEYKAFRDHIDSLTCFTKDQRGPLDMRFAILESFMVPRIQHKKKQSKDKMGSTDSYETIQPGTLTIIDLSCPFVDAATARALFDIYIGLFTDRRPESGLIIALDEAHKYINDSNGTSNLTERLLTTIREQRHNAVRVVIVTQEPTTSTKLLDLCSVTMVHRFTSPAWYKTIVQHLAGSRTPAGEHDDPLFEQIVALSVGESLVFAPSSYHCMKHGEITRLGMCCLTMKCRMRQGRDLGLSKLADEADSSF